MINNININSSINSYKIQSNTHSNKKIIQKNTKFKIKESVLDIIFTLVILIVMIIIIINPKKYTSGTIEGLKLFFYSVMPGLFPFMILTTLLTELGFVEDFFSKFNKISYKIFGTPGISLYVLFMSIISGYPIGAKIISELYQKKVINETEAKKMSVFCTTSGPSFVIGSIGTVMFENHKVGVILYLSHIASSIFIGFLFNIFSKNKTTNYHITKTTTLKQQNIISYSINKTTSSLFVVGAYITIFFLIGEVLDTLKVFQVLKHLFIPLFNLLKIDTKYIQGLLYGILEVTRGAKTFSFFKDSYSIIFTSAILSFSGLSIIFQSLAFLKEAKIKARTFIFYKCVHAFFSALFCYLFLQFIF